MNHIALLFFNNLFQFTESRKKVKWRVCKFENSKTQNCHAELVEACQCYLGMDNGHIKNFKPKTNNQTMKKLLLFILVSLLFIPKSTSQNDGVIAAAAGLAAVGAIILSVDQMKEQAELNATEWLLNNQPSITSFSLKTLDFDGKKAKDMSAVSLITYKIQEFELAEKPKLDGKKYVLFGFTSIGWISDYGVNFNKVRWQLVDTDEWLKMMTAYVKTASSERNDSSIQEELRSGKIVNRGVKGRSGVSIPFYKLEGDMYTVSDYSNSMKLVYNERSLGIYLKETSNLVQIGRGDIIKIHDFFFAD